MTLKVLSDDIVNSSGYDQFGTYIGNNRIRNENEDGYFRTMTIEDWLHGVYTVYVKQFKDAGYDDTTFLMGMKEPDLIEIGIENRGHRKKILSEINRLPPEEIDQDVPVSWNLKTSRIKLQQKCVFDKRDW